MSINEKISLTPRYIAVRWASVRDLKSNEREKEEGQGASNKSGRRTNSADSNERLRRNVTSLLITREAFVSEPKEGCRKHTFGHRSRESTCEKEKERKKERNKRGREKERTGAQKK